VRRGKQRKPKCSQKYQKGSQREPTGAKKDPKGARREPKGNQRESKGSQREPKASQREPKASQRTTKWIKKSMPDKEREKGATNINFLVNFGPILGAKNFQKPLVLQYFLDFRGFWKS
jgi:hypothetical protein